MKKKTVAVYARVSTDKQKVDMQLQEINDFVKRSGWKLHKPAAMPMLPDKYTLCYLMFTKEALLRDCSKDVAFMIILRSFYKILNLSRSINNSD